MQSWHLAIQFLLRNGPLDLALAPHPSAIHHIKLLSIHSGELNPQMATVPYISRPSLTKLLPAVLSPVTGRLGSKNLSFDHLTKETESVLALLGNSGVQTTTLCQLR